jgi:outer membrane receptor protein involved in Fe transport
VVVTATRTRQEAGLVPSPITVLSRADVLASGARTIDESLRSVPGFGLFRDTSSVAASTPTLALSFRGLGGTSASRALVLVDGVPANDAFGGWVQWPRVPVSGVERVEVMRGGSVVWGNLASGGLVNIVTQAPGKDRLSVDGSAGNEGTYEGSFAAGGGSDTVSYGVRGRAFDTKGTFRVAGHQRGPIDQVLPDDHQLLEGVVDVHRPDGRRLRVRAGYFNDDRGLGDPVAEDTTEIREASAGGGAPAGGGDLSLHAWFTDSTFTAVSSSINPARTTATPATNQFDVPAQALGGDVQWVRRLGRHEASTGLDAQWVDGETNEDSRYVSGAFTRRRRTGGNQVVAGLWAQDIFDVTQQFRVLGSLRADTWRSSDGFRDDTDLVTGTTGTTRYDSHDATVVSPRLGLVFRPSPAVTLRASAYGGFRAPTINEQYRPTRFNADNVTESNPALDPERLRGVEAGFLLAPGSRVHADVTVYLADLDDAIFSVTTGRVSDPGGAVVPPCGFLPLGGTCRQRQNVGLLRSKGVETTLEGRVLSGLTAYADAIFLSTEVVDAPNFPQLAGKRARVAPEFVGGGGLRFTASHGFTAEADVRYVGPRYDDDLNTLRIGSSFTLNGAIARDLGAGLTILASGQNLLDRENPVGRNGAIEEIAVSRLFRVGLRYRLGR